MELRQDRCDFLLGKHGRQTARSFRVRDGSEFWPGLMQHVAVQEEERIQGDILGRSCHLSMYGEVGQKCPYFLGSHVIGVTFMVKEDKASDPSEVRFLGAETQVSQTDGVSHLIKQLRFWLHAPSCVSMLLERLRQEYTGISTWLKVIRHFGSSFVVSIKLYPLYIGTHNTEKLSLRHLATNRRGPATYCCCML